MKYLVVIVALLLAGCGKVSDTFRTGMDGYVMRCIDGTAYILMSSDRGLAITPHLGVDGKPKACEVKK